jgi:hypothetical protein
VPILTDAVLLVVRVHQGERAADDLNAHDLNAAGRAIVRARLAARRSDLGDEAELARASDAHTRVTLERDIRISRLDAREQHLNG